MSKQDFTKSGSALAVGDAADAEDIAAALLLRRVENYLRDGKPRQAIAHIVEVTGVDQAQAAAFVAGLQSEVFG